MAEELRKYEYDDGFAVYASPRAELETNFIYKEIFQDKCYDVAQFSADPFVVDAGGNIGMFSLYMKKHYPTSRILAFEPAPHTFDTFQRNMALHNVTGVDVHRCGLGKENSSQALTFYPNMPGNSTLHGKEKNSMLDRANMPDHPVLNLLKTREEVQVDVKRLSDFLDKVPDLTRIDLLKIDVEGAELEVLGGLNDNHWDLVQNIAMEIDNHIVDGTVATAEALLQSKGFTVTTEQAEWAPKEYPMFMIIAKRNKD